MVQDNGRKTVAFPLNGTRRWFLLEHGQPDGDFLTAYHDAITTRQIEVIELLYDHGIDTVLMPLLSPYLFDKRGSKYAETAVSALAYLTDHRKFLDFYKRHNARVRFYGEYEAYLNTPQFQPVLDKMHTLANQTSGNSGRRLYWGVCAHDGTQTAITHTVRYMQQHGTEPTREQLIASYYGEDLTAVDIFITASKFRVFDIPLLQNGREDLYFTVAPSPYFNAHQLRAILYDHLFVRPAKQTEYQQTTPEQWHTMHRFYHNNIDQTFGTGTSYAGTWLPNTQLTQPKER